MSAERLITTPPNARYLSVPQEYLCLCSTTQTRKVTRGENKGQEYTTTKIDEVAATLLYLVERWVLWKCKDGKTSWRDTWVFLSVDQVTEYELMAAFGTYRVAQGFDLLVDRGYLSRRKNPAVKTDQTYQYRFEAEKVQEVVDTLPPFFNFEDWRVQNQNLHPSELKNAKFKTKEAIPHSTSHDPTKKSSAAPPNGGQQMSDGDVSPYHPGDAITWPRKIRGTYGRQEYLHGEVVRLTAKQVVVRVAQTDGEVIERSVNASSLLAGHVDMPPMPAPEPVEIPDSAPEHIALIATWWNSIPEAARPYTKDGKPPYSEEAHRAAALVRRGYTRQHVEKYVTAKLADSFWADKPMTFKHIADHMPAFVEANKLRVVTRPSVHFPPPSPGCKVCGGSDGKHPTGMLRGEDGASIPCPACLAAEQAAQEVRDEQAA
ncbi:MAG: hypothetical protein LC130_28595 [Bryobacterales bacterium]|nr:hypothetical protein [Bryobacterales bacterium]